jgi:hypothetical protein
MDDGMNAFSKNAHTPTAQAAQSTGNAASWPEPGPSSTSVAASVSPSIPGAAADTAEPAGTTSGFTAQQSGSVAVLASAEIRLLAEIGFLACGAGHSRAARLIFEGLKVLRPDRSFPYIGMALSRIEAGANDEAIRILREEGLRASPGNEELQVFLGLALTAARRPSESARILQEVLGNPGPDNAERRLARRLLGGPPEGDATANGDDPTGE